MFSIGKQSNKAPSEDPKTLTKLYGNVILREVADSETLLRYVAYLIDRLAKLYQMQGWTAENTVILAEWVIETYSCEMLQTIDKVLRHPPKTEDRNWRLTPDTVSIWFEKELEDLAVQRENFNHNMKGRTTANKIMEIPEVLAAYENMMMPDFEKNKEQQKAEATTDLVRQREIDGEHSTHVKSLTEKDFEVTTERADKTG